MGHVGAVEWHRWSTGVSGVGESPVWDAGAGALHWVDLFGPTVHTSASAGAEPRTWELSSMPGCLALAGRADAVVAMDSGIWHLDLSDGASTCLVPAPYDWAQYHFTDGRCDELGRLWIGTNKRARSGAPRGSSAFYRLDDRGLVRMFDGVTISNGLAFSPDATRMYHADTVDDSLWVCDYDLATGEASDRRLLTRLRPGSMPDGAAVDVEGYYWVAMYGARCVVRFTPDGDVDTVVEAPVAHPTMVAFGGPDLSTLFLTSARQFADAETLSREPSTGAVFHAEIGVRGLPEPSFAHLAGLLGATGVSPDR